MVLAHRISGTVAEDGSVEVKNVPFRVGERVDVIVMAETAPNPAGVEERYPLRGLQPYRFDDPFTPAVPEEDWDALK